MSKLDQDRILFKAHDVIGYADALHDGTFLERCFVDPGIIPILLDTTRPERVVIGRTGAGKTALLKHIEQIADQVIRFEPDSLALNYVSNSTILSFLLDLDVSLVPFFHLLWKHAFAVELIRRVYRLTDEDSYKAFLTSAWSRIFADGAQRSAIEYLREFGDRFWIESDARVREVTDRVESDLRASIGKDAAFLKARIDAGEKVAQEEKRQIVERAQLVLDKVQVRQLNAIVDLIDVVLKDRQRKWFFVIDGLDDDWVDSRFKLLLVRALLDCVRSFSKVPNLKIIVSLRRDLFDRIFRDLSSRELQKEKYASSCIELRWNTARLTEALDERITQLFRNRYSARIGVTHKDVLVKSMGKKSGPTPLEYMLSRTQLRPRDLIKFFNYCIELAENQSLITAQNIRSAEGRYSMDRLDALYAEWAMDYPNLRAFTRLLRGRMPFFTIADITDAECLELSTDELLHNGELFEDPLKKALGAYNQTLDVTWFKREVFQAFHHVGLVGLKVSNAQRHMYAVDGDGSISAAEIAEDTKVAIHPCYHRALGVNEKLIAV